MQSSIMRLSTETSASKIRRLPTPNAVAEHLTSRQLSEEVDDLKVELNALMQATIEKENTVKLKEMEVWRNDNLKYRLVDRGPDLEAVQVKLDSVDSKYNQEILNKGTYTQMIQRITESNSMVHSEIRDIRDECMRADKTIASLKNSERDVRNTELVAREERNYAASKRRSEIAEWMDVVNGLRDQLDAEDSIYDLFAASADSREAVKIKVKEQYYKKQKKEAEKQKKRVESAVVDTIAAEKRAKHLARSFEVLMDLTNSNDLESLISFFENKDSVRGKLEEQMKKCDARKEALLAEDVHLKDQLTKWRYGDGPDVGGGEKKLPYDDVLIEVNKKERVLERLATTTTAQVSRIKQIEESIGHLRDAEESASKQTVRALPRPTDTVPPLPIAGSSADKEPTSADGIEDGAAGGGAPGAPGTDAADDAGAGGAASPAPATAHVEQKRPSRANAPTGNDIPGYEKSALDNLAKLADSLEKKLGRIRDAGIDPQSRFEPAAIGIAVDDSTLNENNRRVATSMDAQRLRDDKIMEWMTDNKDKIPKAVQLADEDGSGEVDPRELAHAVTKLGFPVTVVEMLRFSKSLDSDKSGYLEIREIIGIDVAGEGEGEDVEVLNRTTVKLKAERMSRGR